MGKNAHSFFIRKQVVAGLLLFVWLIPVWFCTQPSNTPAVVSPYLNHADTVKYVGIDACRNCHNDKYQTFIHTGMGSSFGLATREKSAADFSGHPVVYDKFADLSYHPFWKSDSLYILEYRMSGKDTVHQRTERVSYIIGSGQHTNSHLMQVNGYIYQMPLTWYAQKKKWDLPPGFEQGRNVRFSREIGLECMSCHNAMPTYVEGSVNKFSNVLNGIDCERCHGPGESHVKEKMQGIRVDTSKAIDYTIVNPRKLSYELQIDICQRCHLQGNAVLRPGKSFSDFRPGQKLSDYLEVFMPKYQGHEEEMIMASHAQRLQQSACFLKSSGKLTCITCHNPHVSVKVTASGQFNNACGRCHGTQNTCTAPEQERMLKQNNCSGCHMRRSGTIDIPHVTVTDHKISVPVPHKTREAIRQFAGLYCINNSQVEPATRINACLSYTEKFEGERQMLDSAQVYLSALSTDALREQLNIHMLYLRKDYPAIAQAARQLDTNAITDGWTAYRIGQAYQNFAQPVVAYAWYTRASTLAPENLHFAGKAGAVLVELGQYVPGIRLLETLLEKNDRISENWVNLGFARVMNKEYAAARYCYKRALALDPDHPQALFNQAALCNLTGDKAGAKKLLLQILKRDPHNETVKQLLNSI